MILQLGIANLPVVRASEAADSRAVETDIREYGTTGTPIFGGGFLRDLGEYNPAFQGGPFSAFRTFEKMRRSDAQVSATLSAAKLPIRCAEWSMLPPKDPTPVEREATAFAEKCFFDEIDFNGVIENALLMLDYGVAAHEDIWEPVNGGIRWKKLAARLPLTFYEWKTDPQTEDLLGLVQMGYKGVSFVQRLIPADKLTLFTFRQEGANFAGRSMLREMYQHWYTKSKLYLVDAIACERNGMGVPTVTMGSDAKKEDIALAKEWVAGLSAGEATGLSLPPGGWTFDLVGVKGSVRDTKESIAHHNSMISMAGLAMFMQLGESHSGGRALGDSMSDFFYMGLQATADQVGARISKTSIARLTAMNFGAGVRPPVLVPQQLLALKFETVMEALAALGKGGLMTPSPELEAWVRRKMGAPEADGATITRLRAKTTTVESSAQSPQVNLSVSLSDSGGCGSQPGSDADGNERARPRVSHRSRGIITGLMTPSPELEASRFAK